MTQFNRFVLSVRFLCLLLCVCGSLAAFTTAAAATYYVDGATSTAADTNPGTAASPWKTISRAAGAAELKPGDTVLVKSGVYREAVNITDSGAPSKPLTFAAAPGATVVIKGSTIITGQWSSVSGDPNFHEPYPNAFSRVWKIHLDDSYFQNMGGDPKYISGVFFNDGPSLQQIGQDAIRKDPNILSPIGRGLNDIYENAYYFDAPTQTLYIDIDGRPEWSQIQVGTIGYPLQAQKVHDVNITGFQVRENRQSNASMGGVVDSQRVVVSDCAFTQSDFQGFGFGRCQHCTIKNCVMSYNGDVGFGFYMSEDCLADHCQIFGNNTRHFSAGWHAGGAKNIPGNTRCTMQNCVVADNGGVGIWFDAGNADCRVLHNVVYHNVGAGIMYEISPGGVTVADNLVFSNIGRGIYISGSKGAKIYNNTVAGNDGGIVMMPRGDDGPSQYTLTGSLVQNNLLLQNDSAAQEFLGSDLVLYLGLDAAGKRTVPGNHSQSNVYATGLGMPTVRANWNGDITLSDWQAKYGEDKGSRATPFLFNVSSNTFRITDPQATAKRAVATPLPTGLAWKPANPKLVGSSITAWPITGL